MLKILKGVLCILMLAVLAAISNGGESGLVFYMPFEQPLKAKSAAGNANAVSGSEPGKFVPGVKGRGMQFTYDEKLIFDAKKNIDNRVGSLEFWIKFDAVYPKSCPRIFVEGSGTTKGNLRLMYYDPWEGIFHTHNSRAYGVVGFQLRGKELGSWHHMVMTWNNKIGARFYLDGRFVSHRGHAVSRGATLDYKRDAVQSKTFTIGPYHRKTRMVIDELKIFNRMLSPKEIAAKYQAACPFSLKLESRLLNPDENSQKIFITNKDTKKNSAKISWALLPWEKTDPIKNVKFGKEINIALDSGKTREINLGKMKLPPENGRYMLQVRINHGGYSSIKNLLFVYMPKLPPQQQQESKPKLELSLLKEFDCAKSYTKEEFCDDGTSKVVTSKLGKYRITGTIPYSRFAYRFFIKSPDKLHMAEVTWPDERQFVMEVVVDDANEHHFVLAENGIIAGGHYPNSGKLKKYRLFFYPTAKECAIQFKVWPLKRGLKKAFSGAVKNIKIYQVMNKRLPALKIYNQPDYAKERTVGTQDEDCSTYREFAGFSMPIGFKMWYKALCRRYDYMNYVGQNLFSHTQLHYGGTVFPDSPIGVYSAKINNYPEYWLDMVLYMAEKAGIRFNASMHMLVPPELGQEASLVSKEEMIAGKDTVLSISWNGNGNFNNDNGSWGATPPYYNILHPKAQKLFLSFFEDYLKRYGKYKSFNGFDLLFWRTHMLWIGSLKNGYSDYTVDLFEKETGVKVPGKAPDKNRFIKRYLFLVKKSKVMREKWIAWRCKKVHEFWMKVYKLIQAKRPGTKLVFQCWAALYSYKWDNSRAVVWKRGDEQSIYNFYREGGFDLKLFKDIPYLYIGNAFYPNYTTDASEYIFRDYEFAPARINPFKNAGLSAVHLEQARREKSNWLSTDMPDYWFHEGRYHKVRPAKRKNDIGGAMWKSDAVMPNDDFYLEYYAKCLADWDVREITDGGITTTTLGAEGKLQNFIRAYRTLPTENFELFKQTDDPVCVRRWKDRFYAVNREFYPIKLEFSFSADKFELLNLADNKSVTVNKSLSLEIAPYGLLSFKLPENVELKAVKSTVSPEIIKWLKKRLDNLNRAIAYVEANGGTVPRVKNELAWFKGELKKAWETGRYFRLRKLLDSYWAQNLNNASKNKALQRFFKSKIKQTGKTSVKVNKVASIPDINSKSWNKVPDLNNLYSVIFNENNPYMAKAELATKVKCVYSDKQIAFRFDCPVESPQSLANLDKQKCSEVAEVFLSTSADSKPYYHFRIPFRGKASEKRCCTDRLRFEKPRYYNPSYSVKKEKLADGWRLLFAVPFAELDASPAPAKGAVWRFNVGREIFSKQLGSFFQTLCFGGKYGMHCPDNFGKLIFN